MLKIANQTSLMISAPHQVRLSLAQTLARSLNVRFAIADATALTEAGYVGEDVILETSSKRC